MKQYLELLQHVRAHGTRQADRTGTGTLSVFGYQMRFPLADGFPLVTTRKIHLRSMIYELLWFLRGDTNIKYLNEHGIRIWDQWPHPDGDLGPVYGKQWVGWETKDGRKINQIKELVENLRTNPHSRRHVVSAWNVGDLPKMALSPCHALFQFYVADDKLSCQLYQRSADLFIGVPYNIASYALLTHLVAQQCDLELGDFIWTGGDCHIYLNHLAQVDLQLSRNPLPLPQLRLLRRPSDIFSYRYEDFQLENYQHHKHIAAPVAV